MVIRILVVGMVILLTALPASAQMDRIFKKGKTTGKLTAAFQPVVEKSMTEVGVTRRYNELVGRYQTIPFVKSETFDINHYVVTKTLDGLFHVLGEEEKKIRTNPAARVTDLLKEVFGK